jgi:hypothetical protein
MDYYKSPESAKSQSNPLQSKKIVKTPGFSKQNSSFDSRNLKLRTKFSFSGKCEQLWNAFEHPTQVTLKKINILSGRVCRRKGKNSANNLFIKKAKFSLPPIRNFLQRGDEYEKSDSDDDYGIIAKNMYQF